MLTGGITQTYSGYRAVLVGVLLSLVDKKGGFSEGKNYFPESIA
jgi:hypothetical protein